MSSGYFDSGKALIGSKEVLFEQRLIQDRFRIFVPADFFEDKNIVSRYTYLFSHDKSPLGVAVKFTALSDKDDRRKVTSNYFSQSGGEEANPVKELATGVLYRESVTGGQYLSIYSLRFAVEMEDGVLFGCFTCSSAYENDWREAALEMIGNVSAA